MKHLFFSMAWIMTATLSQCSNSEPFDRRAEARVRQILGVMQSKLKKKLTEEFVKDNPASISKNKVAPKLFADGLTLAHKLAQYIGKTQAATNALEVIVNTYEEDCASPCVQMLPNNVKRYGPTAFSVVCAQLLVLSHTIAQQNGIQHLDDYPQILKHHFITILQIIAKLTEKNPHLIYSRDAHGVTPYDIALSLAQQPPTQLNGKLNGELINIFQSHAHKLTHSPDLCNTSPSTYEQFRNLLQKNGCPRRTTEYDAQKQEHAVCLCCVEQCLCCSWPRDNLSHAPKNPWHRADWHEYYSQQEPTPEIQAWLQEDETIFRETHGVTLTDYCEEYW
jgi:hypothetical protein